MRVTTECKRKLSLALSIRFNQLYPCLISIESKRRYHKFITAKPLKVQVHQRIEVTSENPNLPTPARHPSPPHHPKRDLRNNKSCQSRIPLRIRHRERDPNLQCPSRQTCDRISIHKPESRLGCLRRLHSRQRSQCSRARNSCEAQAVIVCIALNGEDETCKCCARDGVVDIFNCVRLSEKSCFVVAGVGGVDGTDGEFIRQIA